MAMVGEKGPLTHGSALLAHIQNIPEIEYRKKISCIIRGEPKEFA